MDDDCILLSNERIIIASYFILNFLSSALHLVYHLLRCHFDLKSA